MKMMIIYTTLITLKPLYLYWPWARVTSLLLFLLYYYILAQAGLNTGTL